MDHIARRLATAARAAARHYHRGDVVPTRPARARVHAPADAVREHRYRLDLPHSAARLWALMQDYDRWTEYAPMVVDVQVVEPGDASGDGLLRHVTYRLPFGRRGLARERVSDVEPERGYTYTMLSDVPGNDQTGRLRLEPLGPNRTRLHFEERYHLVAWPWRWLEGPIYRFINKKNEESMRRLSQWLTDHPEYRPDLVEPEGPDAG